MPFCMVSGFGMSLIARPAAKSPFCSTICTMKEEGKSQLGHVIVPSKHCEYLATKHTFP